MFWSHVFVVLTSGFPSSGVIAHLPISRVHAMWPLTWKTITAKAVSRNVLEEVLPWSDGATDLQPQIAWLVHNQYQAAQCGDPERPSKGPQGQRCRPKWGEPDGDHWLGKWGSTQRHSAPGQDPACKHGWTTRPQQQASVAEKVQDCPGWWGRDCQQEHTLSTGTAMTHPGQDEAKQGGPFRFASGSWSFIRLGCCCMEVYVGVTDAKVRIGVSKPSQCSSSLGRICRCSLWTNAQWVKSLYRRVFASATMSSGAPGSHSSMWDSSDQSASSSVAIAWSPIAPGQAKARSNYPPVEMIGPNCPSKPSAKRLRIKNKIVQDLHFFVAFDLKL